MVALAFNSSVSNTAKCTLPITVDKNGDVCISILHDPGEDKWGYERPEERWLPIHTVETIIVSVISMLADPNDESPANVDAAVSGRNLDWCLYGVGDVVHKVLMVLNWGTSLWMSTCFWIVRFLFKLAMFVEGLCIITSQDPLFLPHTSSFSLSLLLPLSLLLLQKEWREDYHGNFKKRVMKCVRKSQDML